MSALPSPASFLEALAARGVVVRLDGDGLDVSGPDAVLTPAVVERIRRAKPKILAYLAPTDGPDVSDLAALGAEIDREIRADMDAQKRAGEESQDDERGYGLRLVTRAQRPYAIE